MNRGGASKGLLIGGIGPAGTGLTLALGGQDPVFRVIDTLEVPIARLSGLASGRCSLEQAGIAA